MRKIIILVVVLGLCAAAALAGRKAYRDWRTAQAVNRAKKALASADYKNAGLWLRQAIAADSRRTEAVRLMGDLTEKLQLSEASIFWRKRLVELEPGFTNQLILARCALNYQDYETAKKALQGIGDKDRSTPEFYKIAGALLVATRQPQEAETSFRALVELQPKNPVAQLNLAVLLMQRKEPDISRRGREAVEQLSTNAAVRLEALRHLTQNALLTTNHSRALQFAGYLVGDPNCHFQDHLMELDVLRAAKSARLQQAISACQRMAQTNSSSAFTMSSWMFRNMEPGSTLQWLHSLPPQMTTNLPVAMSLADAYLATTNWTELQSAVTNQYWGDFEYLRRLFASRALKEQNLDVAAKAEWTKSLKEAESHLDRLLSVERVVTGWRWSSELEEVLWAIVNKSPAERRAVEQLSRLLVATGKTRLLLTLYEHEAKATGGNLLVKNNLASVALLLEAEEYHPHRLAAEVYEAEKQNPYFATTFAYSLHLQKKTAEALSVMNALKPEDLEQPGIAGYYALMLASTGETAKAKKYVEFAKRTRLLPEERRLFGRIGF